MPGFRISAVLLALLLAGCGITAPRGNAGYADIDSLGFRDVDRTMTLSIGPTLLRFAAANVEDDEAARDILRQLDGVRVYVYDVVGDGDRVAERLQRMSLKLQDKGWQQVVLVQEPGERTAMLIKVQGDHIAGLAVLTTDRTEAVIVNVMGELRPELFASTMVALDVDVPEVRVAGVAP